MKYIQKFKLEKVFATFLTALPVLCGAVFLVGCGTSEESVDIDPVVAARLELDFTARCDALRMKGVPDSIEDLAVWCPVPEMDNNAAYVYAESFNAEDEDTRLRLLLRAGAMPGYAYPVDWSQPDATLMVPYAVTEGFMDSAHFLGLMVHVAVYDEDDTQIVQALLAGFAMTMHTSGDPFLINQTARLASQHALVDSLVFALTHRQLNEEQLSELQIGMANAYQPDALPRAWFVERTLDGGEDPFGSDPMPEYVEDTLGLMQLRLAWTVLAVERFIRANGAAPEALEILVPEYLDFIAKDMFSGSAIRYEKDANGFVVFCIGPGGNEPAASIPLAEYDATHKTAIYVPFQKRPPDNIPDAVEAVLSEDAAPLAML